MNYENGEYKQGGVMVTRHPNIIRSVMIGKKGWGLWVSEWSDGISQGLFSRNEILEEFENRKIELPESFLKEFDNSIERKMMKKVL